MLVVGSRRGSRRKLRVGKMGAIANGPCIRPWKRSLNQDTSLWMKNCPLCTQHRWAPDLSLKVKAAEREDCTFHIHCPYSYLVTVRPLAFIISRDVFRQVETFVGFIYCRQKLWNCVFLFVFVFRLYQIWEFCPQLKSYWWVLEDPWHTLRIGRLWVQKDQC